MVFCRQIVQKEVECHNQAGGGKGRIMKPLSTGRGCWAISAKSVLAALFLGNLASEEKMRTIVDVNTGEVKLGDERVVLRSVAIGSCICIAAYDSRKNAGAMAHIMLPGTSPENKPAERTKYAVDGINELINRMKRSGSKTSNIEVCLVGAGNVLNKKNDTICDDNIESTTRFLKEKKIPIRASVLGGTKRKGVTLDIENGTMFYTEGDEKEKLLWKSTKNI